MDKQQRAKTELAKLYPGLTNSQVTEIQRERLRQSEAYIIKNCMVTSGYRRFVSLFGRIKYLGNNLPT